MVNLYYWHGKANAGDYFSCWLLQKMNVKFTVSSNNVNLGVTGSILANTQLKNAKIWGCGFHNSTDKCSHKNICAVRGNLSRQMLNLTNIKIGDPGLLASYFYKSKSSKKYKFGIVSHYIDYDFFKSLNLPDNVKLITMGTNDIEKVLDEINECEFILSSSLHGIIFSHSYNIPAIHIKHNELASKNSFKFLDYYSVFDIKYLMKSIKTKEDIDWDEFNLLYENKQLFVPEAAEIKKIQEDLLSVFPYKEEIQNENSDMCNS